jgi:putative ABC transport system permease protein
MALLNQQFLRWLVVANLIAWPIAYFAMQKWLEKFAYRTDIEIWIFLLSAALGLAVALLTVSLQTFRAARANPVDSLKHE